jgi:hypothetical protein
MLSESKDLGRYGPAEEDRLGDIGNQSLQAEWEKGLEKR